MSTRTRISAVIAGMVAAVLFGIGVTLVLTIPALEAQAVVLIPAVIILSFVLAPFVSWAIAPRLRAPRRRPRDA